MTLGPTLVTSRWCLDLKQFGGMLRQRSEAGSNLARHHGDQKLFSKLFQTNSFIFFCNRCKEIQSMI